MGTHISDFKYTFSTLTRLEIFLQRLPDLPSTNDVSPLFTATLYNVRELVIKESLRLYGYENHKRLPLNIHFSKLRRLETIYVSMEPDAYRPS